MSSVIKEAVRQQLAGLLAKPGGPDAIVEHTPQVTEGARPEVQQGQQGPEQLDGQPLQGTASQVQLGEVMLQPQQPTLSGAADSGSGLKLGSVRSSPSTSLQADSGVTPALHPDGAGPGLMLGPASLAGNPEIQGTVKPVGAQLPVVDAGHIQAFVGGVGQLAPSFAPLPLDYAVSDRIREQIWANEYIEFGLLINPTEQAVMSLSVKGDGRGNSELCLMQGRKKLPKSLEEWQAAFAIYSAVYTQKYPDQMAGLLKYGETVKQIGSEGGNFNLYDTTFRKLRVRTPIAWEQFHSELYLKAVRAPRSGTATGGRGGPPNHGGYGYPKGAASNAVTQFPVGYCFRFHAGRECDAGTCAYRHKCYKCQGGHPVFKCNQQKGGGNNHNKYTWQNTRNNPAPGAGGKTNQPVGGGAGVGAKTQPAGANSGSRQ